MERARDEDQALSPHLDNALRRAFSGPELLSEPELGVRYEPLDVVGRGGMGVVHRARDARLDREIAVKTLRPTLASDPSMVRRFLREARILAALDHPAIVSVHELGTTPEGLPFLAMRLIRGESLAKVLGRRGGLDQDRARLMLAFQGICQGVAHAHERGVIHRDLKPANVMLGAHGEVQVVDWGLARQLGPDADEVRRNGRATQLTVTESPMGTPAYMAPELARAEHGSVGFQADVFGLGSILCEILTGQPPHGGTPIEALRAAAAGETGAAVERLEATSEPTELIALAARCLCVDPAERPADAGEVSRQFADCLARMDERSRDTQMRAVAAQTQAVEERKRRRVTVALSAVIVSLVVCGCAIWAVARAGQEGRRDRIADAIEEALSHAGALRAAARAAEPGEIGPWRRALDASQHARTLAKTPDASCAWRRRAEAEFAISEAAFREASTQADDRRSLEVASSELANARTLRLTDCGLVRCDAAYRGFLASHGVEAQTTDPATVTRAIAAAGEIAPLLVSALDEWAEVRSLRRATDAPDVATLTRLSAAADPDPWRNGLRRHVGTGNRSALRKHLAAADPRGLDEASLALAAPWITHIKLPDQAARWHEIAELRFPRNAWIHHVAALDHLRRGHAGKAAASWRAALATHPEVPALWRGLASALVETDPSSATEVCRLAIAKGMRCSKLWIELGRAQAALGQSGLAVETLMHAASISRPHDAEAYVHLGEVQAKAGRHEEARAALDEALAREPRSVRAHVALAELHASAGQLGPSSEHLAAAHACKCGCTGAAIAQRIELLETQTQAARGDE